MHRLISIGLSLWLLLGGAFPAFAQSAEVAALEARLAQALAEIAAVEAEIEALDEDERLERLKRAELTAGFRSPPSGLQNVDEVRAEIEAMRAAETDLNELARFSSRQKDKIRGALQQLRGYADRVNEIHKINVIKTALSMGVQTAQELAAFATTSGKPVEILTWTADKLSGELMKRTLDGSREYINQKIAGISGAAAAVSPEMDRLAQLSSLSLEGWRAYLNKYEDKDIVGSTGLILGKGRILQEHILRAEDSLIRLHRELDQASTEAEQRLSLLQEYKLELEGLAAAMQVDAAAIEAFNMSAGGQAAKRQALVAQLGTLNQAAKSAHDALNAAVRRPPAASGVSEAVQVFATLDDSFIDQLPGFEGHVQDAIGNLATFSDAVSFHKQSEKALQEALERHLKDFAGLPVYPAESVTDEVGIANMLKLRKAEIELYRKEVKLLGEVRQQLDAVADRLVANWRSPPFDEGSFQRRGTERSLAYTRARRMLDEALREEGETRDLKALDTELKRRAARQFSNPFLTEAQTTLSDGRVLSGSVADVVSSATADASTLTHQLAEQLDWKAQVLVGYENGLETMEAEARSQSELRKARFRVDAARAVAAANDMADRLSAYNQSMRALRTELDSLAGAGVLTRDHRINFSWIDGELGQTPRDCRGVERVHEVLLEADGRLSQLRMRADQAHAQAVFGTMSLPISIWSELNEPQLHRKLEAVAEKQDAAWQQSQTYQQLPPSDPISGLAARLPGDNLTLVQDFPQLLSGLQKARSEIDASITIAEQQARQAMTAERVAADWLAGVKGSADRIEAEIELRLGCFDMTHQFRSELEPKLDALREMIAKIGPKAVYVDVSARIEALAALHERVRNFPVAESETYRTGVRQFEAAYHANSEWFEANKGIVFDEQRQQLGKLIHDISLALSGHLHYLGELAARDRKPSGPSNEQIQRLYQDFINAYGKGDLRGLLRLLGPQWQGGDGADLRGVEEVLVNSFRVFDRIQYRVSGFNATVLADGTAQVSYKVDIVGENRRQRLTHTESSNVVELVGIVDGQPRILRTLSGTQWLR